MKPIRLMTLAPGHFHAALVQKQMAAGVASKCYVYAPLDADTAAHLERLAAFNTRPDSPTHWDVDLRAGVNWFNRFFREQPGNTVVLSGRNRPKIDLMRHAVSQGLFVLADKPWVIDFADFRKLEELFRDADLREVLIWDVMTERHEVTNRLQRELVRDPDIFGGWQTGSPEQPALVLESVHHLKKSVAGQQLVRPWWWFDSLVSGEAMADVGTHLADLAIWLVAPDCVIDYLTDIAMLAAESWPLVISGEQFRDVTGLANYPPELATRVVNGQLYYTGNGSALFALGDIHVRLATQWEFEAPPGGGDTHHAVALGTRSRVSVRQPPGGDPDVFVSATDPADHPRLVRQLFVKCDDLRDQFPGLSMIDRGSEVQFRIPDELRLGHEGHFALVMEEFGRYFHNPRAVPMWERPNLLAKYYITTKAVELAKERRAAR
jgi:predicted dehydrogenase